MTTAHDFSVSDRAEKLYEQKLKSLLEPTHRGQFLAIEPESGDYFLSDDFDGAINASRSVHPDRLAYVMRIGYPAVMELGYAYDDR